MNFRRFVILFTLSSLILFGLWLPAGAAPSTQTYFTPTAQPDGRIIYIVDPGDTCIRVALLNGISVEQLRQLNSKLDENCTLIEGQELLIGLVGPASGTETPGGPTVTPGAATLTPTPFTGTTEICVLLFNDQNGDSLRQEIEPAIAGGAVSVTEISGKYSAALDTIIVADPELYQGICFTDVPEGTYNISVAIPDQYNPTMDPAYNLEVRAGDRAFVDFGAQSTETTVTQPEDSSDDGGGSSTSTVLGIFAAPVRWGRPRMVCLAFRAPLPQAWVS
jgi:murein DD-endopeptidase MepM/ murein hydrolase activator NlpD